MTTLQFVDLSETTSSIYEQLMIEEALLRTSNENWCLVNRGSAPTIVLGISGKVDELVHVDAAEAAGVPLLKRFSGGGTVVVDENTLFVSFIGNHELLPCTPFPKPIMLWSEAIYRSFLGDKGFSLRCHDYALGERKIGGNAQSLTRNRFVHHTTFLWDYLPERMALLKQPKNQPAYREGRDHDDFVTTLSTVLSKPSDLFDGLHVALEERFSVRDVDKIDFERLQALPHRKATKYIKKKSLLAGG